MSVHPQREAHFASETGPRRLIDLHRPFSPWEPQKRKLCSGNISLSSQRKTPNTCFLCGNAVLVSFVTVDEIIPAQDNKQTVYTMKVSLLSFCSLLAPSDSSKAACQGSQDSQARQPSQSRQSRQHLASLFSVFIGSNKSTNFCLAATAIVVSPMSIFPQREASVGWKTSRRQATHLYQPISAWEPHRASSAWKYRYVYILSQCKTSNRSFVIVEMRFLFLFSLLGPWDAFKVACQESQDSQACKPSKPAKPAKAVETHCCFTFPCICTFQQSDRPPFSTHSNICFPNVYVPRRDAHFAWKARCRRSSNLNQPFIPWEPHRASSVWGMHI